MSLICRKILNKQTKCHFTEESYQIKMEDNISACICIYVQTLLEKKKNKDKR